MLILFGVASAAVMAELALRVCYPDGGIPAAHLVSATSERQANFHEDPECGYLPIPERGEYNAQGCVPNSYKLNDHRRTRVLFLGDSATHRGRIIHALKKCYGDRDYEYWNGGVESFNTFQELVFYRRYQVAVHPDEVVLTFHNNDFLATPLVVRENGQLKVYTPGVPMNSWLFSKSYLYRWAWPRSERADLPRRTRQVLDSLAEFKATFAAQSIAFKVILLPILKTESAWNDQERWSRRQSLEDFHLLGLHVFDLLPTLESALRSGVVATETAGDTWHPSDAVAERFAHQLVAEKLLVAPIHR